MNSIAPRRRLWRLLLAITAVSTWQSVKPDPGINLLNKGCSQYNVTNIPEFYSNLNSSFSELRAQLSSGKLFAATQHPVYAMVQCRDYMSERDCLSCYDAAVKQIRDCSAANGARVIYDGCFLRHESNKFYDQTTLPGNVQICGNRTAKEPSLFNTNGQTLLKDLELATPRVGGYFTATNRQVSSGVNSTIYAIAQCAQTVSQTGCSDCLTVAYSNIQGCLPNADGRAVDAGCFMRYSDTPFFSDNNTIDITPFLNKGGDSSKKKAIIGGVVGGVGLILILGILVLLRYHYSQKPKSARGGNILGATELQGPNIYSYKDLKSATNNFSEENKLGEGGFGDVYKATLKNGNIVAVKKLNISNNRARADFEGEVRLISNVHHRNLVRLLGCCNKGPELLLIYEYMANGSLDRFLYGEKRGGLSWKQRFDIIIGTARGLAYLHEQYHVCIIHRDIKPGNILLDNEFQAKIADFGLARLFPENRSHISTKFAGTLGYTAPEYAIHGHLSEKVDTYSFGVVILEIISGRRSSEMNAESDSEYLLEEAWKLYETGTPQILADEALNSDECSPEDVKKMVEISLICTQSPSLRPTMSEVLVMLLSDRSIQQRGPSRPALNYANTVNSETATDSTGASYTNATASISHFSGR